MSLANTTQLEALEYRFEQMRLAFQQLAQTVSKLQSDLANQQLGGGGGSGGGGYVYFINPVVIAAGGSVASQQIYTNVAGTLTATSFSSATVWNMMAQPTVATAGKTIIVGANGDGTFSAITQSC